MRVVTVVSVWCVAWCFRVAQDPRQTPGIVTGDSMLWSGGAHSRAMLSPPGQHNRFLQTPEAAGSASGGGLQQHQQQQQHESGGGVRPRPRQQTWLVLEFCDKGCLQVCQPWARQAGALTALGERRSCSRPPGP